MGEPRAKKFARWATGQEPRKNWSESRQEAERKRSVDFAKLVCKCGSSKLLAAPVGSGVNGSRTTAYAGHKIRSRCRNCAACLREKCGQCSFCLHPRLKKACAFKKCEFPVVPKCPCFKLLM